MTVTSSPHGEHAGTQHTADSITSDALDELYERVEFYEAALARMRDRYEVTVVRVRKATANSFMAGPNAVDVVRVADVLAALTETTVEPS